MTDEQEKVEEPRNEKEYNFRVLEQKLAKERAEKEEAYRLIQEYQRKKPEPEDEEEDYSDPYVDTKKLNKTLNKFGQSTQQEIQKAMEMTKAKAKEELRQELWLEQNPDFYETLKHAENFANKAPQLAESILKMPEGFERQKLVYQNIKALGIDKPEQKVPSIQEKIDSNRRGAFYSPSSVGAAPYAMAGDFSETGQKQAYDKLQELKKNLRI